MRTLRFLLVAVVVGVSLMASGMASAATRGGGGHSGGYSRGGGGHSGGYYGGGHYSGRSGGYYGGGHYGGRSGGYYRGGGHYSGYYRGGYYGHHRGYDVDVWFGPYSGWGYPYYYPYYSYSYPYYYPYSYPYTYYPYAPSYNVPSEPREYIERDESSSEPSDFWYYCRESKAYYPYVKGCPGGWQKVPAQPPSEPVR